MVRHNKICYFDGNLPHCTLDITGNQERFSLIFFCTQGAVSDKFDEVERQQVQSMGFVLPPAGTSAHVYQPAKVEKRFEIGQKQFRQFQAKRTHDEEGVTPRPVKVAKRALEAGQEKVTLSAFGVGLSEPAQSTNEQVLPSAVLSCERPKPAEEFMFTIISKGRSANVPTVEKLFENTGTSPVWVVGEGEKNDYMGNGATTVYEGGKLCDQL